MVQFAPRLWVMSVVRESSPAYGLTPDGLLAVNENAGHENTRDESPGDDADVIEALGDEIATLAAHIHAAVHRLLVLLAEFDRRQGWELEGHRSCAHWLAFRTGIDLGAAREKVRAARALVGLPETSAAMARGELSFSQVRALTRVGSQTREFRWCLRRIAIPSGG